MLPVDNGLRFIRQLDEPRRGVPDGGTRVILDCILASEDDLGHGIAWIAITSDDQVIGNRWELWEGKLGGQNSVRPEDKPLGHLLSPMES